MLHVVSLGGFLLCVGFSFIIWWNLQHYLLEDRTASTNELDQTIHLIRFNVSKITRTIPGIPASKGENLVKVYASQEETLTDSIRHIVEDEYPVILMNTVAAHWNALKWDLWDLAASSLWPVLSNVLSLEHTQEFLLQNQREHSGMIIGDLMKNQTFPVAIDMMYLADFLNDLRNTSCLYFYSVNFRVFESLAKVREQPPLCELPLTEYL